MSIYFLKKFNFGLFLQNIHFLFFYLLFLYLFLIYFLFSVNYTICIISLYFVQYIRHPFLKNQHFKSLQQNFFQYFIVLFIISLEEIKKQISRQKSPTVLSKYALQFHYSI